MKKLVILLNGNFVSVALNEGLKLDSIVSDISNPDGANISFDSDAGAHIFLKRSMIDGYYVTNYIEPKKDTTSQELLNLLKKMASGGDEWRNES